MRVIYPDYTPFEHFHRIEKSDQDYYSNVVHNVTTIAIPKTEEKGMHPDEKSTRKSSSKKSKKIHSRADKTTMAKI